MVDDLRSRATELLRRLTGRADAEFRDGQLEAIEALVGARRRALVVQRTGWGKSAVYFVATRLLRDAGAGPTVLISPLLALMRNQIAAAERAGVVAATINSDNLDDWGAIERDVLAGRVDLLLISPERLNNVALPARRASRPPGPHRHAGGRRGPLHQRLGPRLPPRLPPHRPRARRSSPTTSRCCARRPRRTTAWSSTSWRSSATTSRSIRGPLDRESLSLRVLDLARPGRTAWHGWPSMCPKLPGSGIVYCLTIARRRAGGRLAQPHGIDAVGLQRRQRAAAIAQRAEDALLANKVKVARRHLGAGMGFDKPDLGLRRPLPDPGLGHRLLPAGRTGRARPRAGRRRPALRATRTATSRTTSSARRSRPGSRPRRVVGLLEASRTRPGQDRRDGGGGQRPPVAASTPCSRCSRSRVPSSGPTGLASHGASRGPTTTTVSRPSPPCDGRTGGDGRLRQHHRLPHDVPAPPARRPGRRRLRAVRQLHRRPDAGGARPRRGERGGPVPPGVAARDRASTPVAQRHRRGQGPHPQR